MNMLFSLIPTFIGGGFLSVLLYLVMSFLVKKFSQNHQEVNKQIKQYIIFIFVVLMGLQVFTSWNTYGYRVKANPFEHNTTEYKPEKTTIQTGKKLIEYDDKRKEFHKEAMKKPE